MKKALWVLPKNFSKLNFKLILTLDIMFLILFQIFFIIISATNLIDNSNKNIVLTTLSLFSLVIIFILIGAYFFMMESMKDILKSAKKLSEGNLNINDVIILQNNDFKVLAKTFNGMKSNLLFFVENTKKIITTLSDSFEQVSSSMEMTCVGNEQIASTIQKIAAKSQEQLETVKDTLAMMDNIYNSINNISDRINDVEKSASVLNSSSIEGRDSLNSYSNSITMISSSMISTSEFIFKLQDSISEITEVTEFITEISDQLKLLSLNASIEAARSGEAGKGFAVVANEITNLSDATKGQIEKINIFVSNMLQSSGNVENSIKGSIDDFKKGNEIFTVAKNIFNGINDKNATILNDVNEIVIEVSNISSLAKETSELSKSVYESSAVVSRDTEEVAAVSQELFAQFQEINEVVTSLKSVMGTLENSAQTFNTGVKPLNINPSKPLNIAILISGSTTSQFWKEIAQGALYARKELADKNTKIDLIRVPVGNNMTEHRDYFIDLLKKCVEDRVDGICLLANFEEFIPIVNNAVDVGIPVITLNSDFKGKSKRLACVQQDQYDSGVVAASELSKNLGGKGNILIVGYKEKIESMEVRIQGFKDTISQDKKIKIVDTSFAEDTLDATCDKFKKYLKENTNIDGIYYTARFKLAIAKAIEESGLSGKIKCVVYDIDAATLKYIKSGAITCTIGQDPFGQGHDPIIYIYNYLVTKEKPLSEKLWTRIDVIDSDNVDNFLN